MCVGRCVHIVCLLLAAAAAVTQYLPCAMSDVIKAFTGLLLVWAEGIFTVRHVDHSQPVGPNGVAQLQGTVECVLSIFDTYDSESASWTVSKLELPQSSSCPHCWLAELPEGLLRIIRRGNTAGRHSSSIWCSVALLAVSPSS